MPKNPGVQEGWDKKIVVWLAPGKLQDTIKNELKQKNKKKSWSHCPSVKHLESLRPWVKTLSEYPALSQVPVSDAYNPSSSKPA
jgi:hypothetical protein